MKCPSAVPGGDHPGSDFLGDPPEMLARGRLGALCLGFSSSFLHSCMYSLSVPVRYTVNCPQGLCPGGGAASVGRAPSQGFPDFGPVTC